MLMPRYTLYLQDIWLRHGSKVKQQAGLALELHFLYPFWANALPVDHADTYALYIYAVVRPHPF